MSTDASTTAAPKHVHDDAPADPFPYTPDFDEMDGSNLDTSVKLTEPVRYELPEPTKFDSVADILADIEHGLPTLAAFPTVQEIERALAMRRQVEKIEKADAKTAPTPAPEAPEAPKA